MNEVGLDLGCAAAQPYRILINDANKKGRAIVPGLDLKLESAPSRPV
jgi:hypothetical protein